MYPKNHEKRAPAAATVLPSIFRFFKITSIFDAIFDLSYLHFCTQKSILGPFGPSWERLGPSWERLGRVLGRLGRVLARLGRVLGRLGRVLGRKTTQDKPDLTWNGKRRSF